MDAIIVVAALLVKLVFAMLLVGWIPALIARNKGRSFAKWWVYGGALFIVALIHSLVLKDLTTSEVTASGGLALLPESGEPVGKAIAKLQSPDASVREQAASELGAMGREAMLAVTTLEEMRGDSSYRVRTRVQWALENIRKGAK